MKKLSAFVFAFLLAAGVTASADMPSLGSYNEAEFPFHTVTTETDVLSENIPSAVEAKLPARVFMDAAVQHEVGRFNRRVEADQKVLGPMKAWVSYRVGMTGTEGKKTSLGTLTSIVLRESTYPDHAAHPMSYIKGLTFDEQGNLITTRELLKAIGGITRDELKEKLETQAKAENIDLFNDQISGNWDIPKESYVGKDGHLYLVFQLYEVAPYAAGFIAVDVGVL